VLVLILGLTVFRAGDVQAQSPDSAGGPPNSAYSNLPR
jgi:hypothetical protein